MSRRILLLSTICVGLLITSPVGSGADIDQSIVVGTYAYKSIDRKASIIPLANFVSDVSKTPTEVIVFKSPTALAEAFASGAVQIAVPNLVGYALIAVGSKDHMLLAVPDNKNSTYTSSIVTNFTGKSLKGAVSKIEKPIGMVWADSTSGAIIGGAHLNSISSKNTFQLKQQTSFLGSHQNVINALINNEIEIGVVATKVYLDNLGYNGSPLSELWRSKPIPFGPIVCSAKTKNICNSLRPRLLSGSKESTKVLIGLQNGWVEFETSTHFTNPVVKDYTDIIEHFRSGS